MKILNFTIFSILSLALCGCINIASRTNTNQVKIDINAVDFDQNTFDCVILGGGIGGLTASIYVARSGYTPIIIQGEIPGGLITQSTDVENWPGEVKISGQELANKIRTQALKQNVKILKGRVSGVNFQKWPYTIYLKSLDSETVTEIKCLSCIITMGTKPNLLHVPGEMGPDGYFGKGVSTCAVCDGSLYRNKTVSIVGGGDSAATEALYLSKIAKKVYMIVRSDKLRANFANQKNLKLSPNIEILFETKITKINGNGEKVTSISTLNNKTGKETDIRLDGVFLAIGATPNTENLKNELELDENGYIKLFHHQETSKKGIFAAGDISDPKFKQAITAAGDSVKASLQVIKFLTKIGHSPKNYTEPKSISEQKHERKNEPENKEITDVINIESEAQFNEILSRSEFVIADFYGSFCIPCQQMEPIFKKVAQDLTQDMNGKIIFVKINVEKNSVLTQKNNITGVPTFIIFKNGQSVKQFVGMRDNKKLKKEIDAVLTQD